MLNRAIEFAHNAHKDQLDKEGLPAILHPIAVMNRMESELEKIIAILHDTVEDCDVSVLDIRQAFGIVVSNAVDAISRREGEKYFDYIQRCKQNIWARKVKIADIEINAQRGINLPDYHSMLKRYNKALVILREE